MMDVPELEGDSVLTSTSETKEYALMARTFHKTRRVFEKELRAEKAKKAHLPKALSLKSTPVTQMNRLEMVERQIKMYHTAHDVFAVGSDVPEDDPDREGFIKYLVDPMNNIGLSTDDLARGTSGVEDSMTHNDMMQSFYTSLKFQEQTFEFEPRSTTTARFAEFVSLASGAVAGVLTFTGMMNMISKAAIPKENAKLLTALTNANFQFSLNVIWVTSSAIKSYYQHPEDGLNALAVAPAVLLKKSLGLASGLAAEYLLGGVLTGPLGIIGVMFVRWVVSHYGGKVLDVQIRRMLIHKDAFEDFVADQMVTKQILDDRYKEVTSYDGEKSGYLHMPNYVKAAIADKDLRTIALCAPVVAAGAFIAPDKLPLSTWNLDTSKFTDAIINTTVVRKYAVPAVASLVARAAATERVRSWSKRTGVTAWKTFLAALPEKKRIWLEKRAEDRLYQQKVEAMCASVLRHGTVIIAGRMMSVNSLRDFIISRIDPKMLPEEVGIDPKKYGDNFKFKSASTDMAIKNYNKIGKQMALLKTLRTWQKMKSLKKEDQVTAEEWLWFSIVMGASTNKVTYEDVAAYRDNFFRSWFLPDVKADIQSEIDKLAEKQDRVSEYINRAIMAQKFIEINYGIARDVVRSTVWAPSIINDIGAWAGINVDGSIENKQAAQAILLTKFFPMKFEDLKSDDKDKYRQWFRANPLDPKEMTKEEFNGWKEYVGKEILPSRATRVGHSMAIDKFMQMMNDDRMVIERLQGFIKQGADKDLTLALRDLYKSSPLDGSVSPDEMDALNKDGKVLVGAEEEVKKGGFLSETMSRIWAKMISMFPPARLPALFRTMGLMLNKLYSDYVSMTLFSGNALAISTLNMQVSSEEDIPEVIKMDSEYIAREITKNPLTPEIDACLLDKATWYTTIDDEGNSVVKRQNGSVVPSTCYASTPVAAISSMLGTAFVHVAPATALGLDATIGGASAALKSLAGNLPSLLGTPIIAIGESVISGALGFVGTAATAAVNPGLALASGGAMMARSATQMMVSGMDESIERLGGAANLISDDEDVVLWNDVMRHWSCLYMGGYSLSEYGAASCKGVMVGIDKRRFGLRTAAEFSVFAKDFMKTMAASNLDVGTLGVFGLAKELTTGVGSKVYGVLAGGDLNTPEAMMMFGTEGTSTFLPVIRKLRQKMADRQFGTESEFIADLALRWFARATHMQSLSAINPDEE